MHLTFCGLVRMASVLDILEVVEMWLDGNRYVRLEFQELDVDVPRHRPNASMEWAALLNNPYELFVNNEQIQ